VRAKHSKWFQLVALTATAIPVSALAYDFLPTEAEFSAWPSYCQARYVSLPIGENSPWALQIPRSQIEQASKQLGEAVFGGIQHYCAGTVWLRRAKVQPDKALRAFYLRTAKSETMFTLTRLPPDTPMIAPVTTNLAFVYYEEGDFKAAIDLLEEVAQRQPENPATYSALALIHRDRKRLDLARDVLLRGDKVIDGRSAEIQYNLGLVLLELGDISEAQVRARKAYELGYPLPGLRNKLKRMGHPIDSPGDSPG
jgi:Flp pilus assembly protein TadD